MKVALAATVLVAVMAGAAMGQQAKKAPPPPRKAEDAVTPAVKNPERHERFMERKKQGPIDLLLLGDSITDGWPRGGKSSWAEIEKLNVANFGIGGDRTEHVLWRITNGELDGIKPKVVMILIGTNNIGHFEDERPEWAAAGVEKIVGTVREKLPEAKVVLMGVFPRDDAGSSKRQRVEELNKLIAKLGDGERVKYVEIGKRFLDENGELPKELMPDKLHLSEKGYEIWWEEVGPVIREMMKG